jgi:hypothetical protein
MSYVTHFSDQPDDSWDEPTTTLCGQPVEAIIMNDRPATCRECRRIHHAAGWTFPLPETVTSR